MDEINAACCLYLRHLISTDEFLDAYSKIVDGE
jgi:hypothetical protein